MKRRGFSLLEVVVSMLILSIVIPGVLGILVTASKHLIEARNRLQAAYQSQAVLEKLRWYVSEDPNSPTGAGTVFSIGTTHSPTEIGLGAYPDMEGAGSSNWSYVVTEITGTNCREVSATLNWEEE